MLNLPGSIINWCAIFVVGLATLVSGASGQGYLDVRRSQSDRVIIFVHGLFGEESESFRDWADLFAADRQPAGRIPLSNYSIASLYYFGFPRPNLTAQEISAHFLSEVRQYIAQNRVKQVNFIAHSLGAVMLQQVLIDAVTVAPDLLEKTRVVVFLAAPSTITSIDRFWRLPQFVGVRSLGSQQTEWLLSDDGINFLRSVQKRWDNLRYLGGRIAKFNVYCIDETRPLRGMGKPVVETGMSIGPCDERFLANEDHFSIARPATKDSPVYRFVTSKIIAAASRPSWHDWIEFGYKRNIKVGGEFCVLRYGNLGDRGYCGTVLDLNQGGWDTVQVRVDRIVRPEASKHDEGSKQSDECTDGRNLSDLASGGNLTVPRTCIR